MKIIILGQIQDGKIQSLLGSDSILYVDGRFGRERTRREIREKVRSLAGVGKQPTHWGEVRSAAHDPAWWNVI